MTEHRMKRPVVPEPGKHCEHECVCQDAIGLIKLGYRIYVWPDIGFFMIAIIILVCAMFGIFTESEVQQ